MKYVIKGEFRCWAWRNILHNEIDEILKSLKDVFLDRFYLEIQRHNDIGEKLFENFLLEKSKNLNIPLMPTHEVFYLDKDMYEAHDALICIGEKTYLKEKKRKKYSNQHYLKSSNEMIKIFSDLSPCFFETYCSPLGSIFA